MASNSDINLKTLQRVDSNIIEIIDTASQVAIYKYDRKLEKWDGTDIEGTLFLYRRSLYPCHGFIIVNRMNTNNFIESITSDMQFQLQEPYLLYKNHTGDIIGSWFYECKDLQRISKKIQTIVLKQSTVPRRQRCASESESHPVGKDGGQDIMTLLSEAHKEYMKSVKDLHSPTSDVNRMSTYPEKKSPKKCIGEPVPYDSLSPRRRFKSTESSVSERKCNLNLEIQNTKENGGWVRSEKETRVACNNWVAPTKLSPLFSRNEINSPVSDVEFLSYEPSPSDGFIDNKFLLQNQKSFDMSADCDSVHSAAMKQSLMSHVQEDPKMMLKIHEAYVSSLRSLFTKD